MNDVVEFRCPNRFRVENPSEECRHIMGGISLDSLRAHDFSVPIRDIRYCVSCNMFWEVTITGLGKPLKMEAVEERIPFVNADNVFYVTSVEGRRAKQRKTGNDTSHRNNRRNMQRRAK